MDRLRESGWVTVPLVASTAESHVPPAPVGQPALTPPLPTGPAGWLTSGPPATPAPRPQDDSRPLEAARRGNSGQPGARVSPLSNTKTAARCAAFASVCGGNPPDHGRFEPLTAEPEETHSFSEPATVPSPPPTLPAPALGTLSEFLGVSVTRPPKP